MVKEEQHRVEPDPYCVVDEHHARLGNVDRVL